MSAYPGERTDLACGDCGSPMTLKSSRYGLFYSCSRWPACEGTHGADADGSPKGIPANRATREARIRAHAAFDRLWRDAHTLYEIREQGERRKTVKKRLRGIARGRAYRWLEEQLGIEPTDSHMGSWDIETCERVIGLCSDQTPEAIRTWAKARKAVTA